MTTNSHEALRNTGVRLSKLVLQTPEPLGFPRKEVANIVHLVKDTLGVSTIATDLVSVVHKLGGTIQPADWDEVSDESWASLEVRGPSNWTIFLPSFTGPLDDRFAISHEIGHYVLHSRLGKKPIRVNLSPTTKDFPVEIEANWFAVSWLMPSEQFRKEMSRLKRDIDLLSDHFQVPRRAAERRVAEVDAGLD